MRLSAFRSLERLPGASHPAVYRVVFACSCGGEHEGLVTHDDLDWAPLGASGAEFFNLMTARVESATATSLTWPHGGSGRVTGRGPSSATRRTAHSPSSHLPFSSSRPLPKSSGLQSAVRSASARPSTLSAARTWISRSTTTATFRWSSTSSSEIATIASPPSGKSSIRARSTCGVATWPLRRVARAVFCRRLPPSPSGRRYRRRPGGTPCSTIKSSGVTRMGLMNRDRHVDEDRVVSDDEVVDQPADRNRYARSVVRALFTLAGVAVAGLLIWIASNFDLGSDERVLGSHGASRRRQAWRSVSLSCSAAGRSGGHRGSPQPSSCFAWLPTLIAAGWILLATQPTGGWQQSRFESWSDTIGILGFVRDLGPFAAAIALAFGVVTAFIFDTTGPRERHVERTRTVATRTCTTTGAKDGATIAVPTDRPTTQRSMTARLSPRVRATTRS